MTTFQLSQNQASKAEQVAQACLQFEKSVDYPLGVALIEFHFGDGTPGAVVSALGAFQNDDGGFGRGLEVDIGSPASNPFASRLAMHVLLSLRDVPADPLVVKLGSWLNSNQNEDGDWHFSDEVKRGELAPWFAGWTFPSLNPACCLAGSGNALGLLEQSTLKRTTSLFERLGSVEEAKSAPFYGLLPYVEYFQSIDHPRRDEYLDAVAANISAADYDDAGHFFDHALGGGPDLVSRLDGQQLSEFADRLLNEPDTDGGWPNPYSEPWRPLASAMAVTTLAKLRNGV